MALIPSSQLPASLTSIKSPTAATRSSHSRRSWIGLFLADSAIFSSGFAIGTSSSKIRRCSPRLKPASPGQQGFKIGKGLLGAVDHVLFHRIDFFLWHDRRFAHAARDKLP